MKQYHEALHDASIPADAFMRKTFTSITFEGPKLTPQQLNAYPTMVVSSHRSHADYILLGIQFHKLGLMNLRFAAGDNLTTMPVIGPRFISYGAFSVYRAQAHRRNYIFELTGQVVDMLNNRDTIIVFPEGGRSYSGSMMEMKSGILAASIIAQHRSPDQDFVYLPSTISYEQLPELLYFDVIGKGRNLRSKKETAIAKTLGNILYFGGDLFAIAKFMLAHRIGKNFGALFIDYGSPIPVKEIVDLKAHFHSQARNEFFAHKVSIQKAGEEIRRQLLRLYRMLPVHIVASIVNKEGSISRNEAVHRVADLMVELEKKKRNLKTLAPMSTQDIIDRGIEQLRYSKSLLVKNGTLAVKNKSLLNYYAAAIED